MNDVRGGRGDQRVVFIERIKVPTAQPKLRPKGGRKGWGAIQPWLSSGNIWIWGMKIHLFFLPLKE